MGLLGTKRAPRRGRVLRASGMRVEIGKPETIRALAYTRQEWQSDAWGYRDMIGELRFALQFRARAVSRVKYFAAQTMPEEDEPVPLNADSGVTLPLALRRAAQEELARLPLESGFEFLGVLDENLGVTGEGWLHGHSRYGEEQWDVLSVDEVVAGTDGRMSLKEFGTTGATPIPENEDMLRMWVPHPRFKILADSPMKALLPVCEEIILAGRELRAASRSRVSANGLLLVPDGLTLLNALKEDSSLVDDSEFMADLAATLLAPIGNEGDPGAVVPAVVTGTIEDLNAVRHLRLEREDSGSLLSKVDKGLGRLATGLDVPPEIITGMAAANHWTAWQIDASTFRNHIEPSVRIVADSLTSAFLRPALLARGFPAEQVRLVQVWYDAGGITENTNRGQDAKDAYDRGAIGMEPLRQALGFNPADAPDDEEILRMVAFKIGIDPATSGLLLQTLFGKGEPITTSNTGAAPVQAEATRVDETPALPPGQKPTADQATPSTGQTAGAKRLISFLLADAAPQVDTGDWVVDDRAGRDLMELDRAERDRLLYAADAALTRALEKAGAKLKSKAQKDKGLSARLAGVDVFAVGQVIGREMVLALGTNEQELLAEAFDVLEGKFTRWAEASIERAIEIVLRLLRVEAASDRGERISKRLRDGMSGRVGAGWALLKAGLFKLAERYLYDSSPVEDQGELVPDVIVPPGLVRGALAYVGGSPAALGGDEPTTAGRERPPGGIALGNEVQELLDDEGAEELGFEWAYGITTKDREFEPHKELDGQRFTSWADPKLVPGPKFAWIGEVFEPGDHRGCMCDYVPTYAIQEYAQAVAEGIGPESVNARNDRLLAESDDAAGRTGTTAQQARDERQRILALKDRYIKAGSK